MVCIMDDVYSFPSAALTYLPPDGLLTMSMLIATHVGFSLGEVGKVNKPGVVM